MMRPLRAAAAAARPAALAMLAAWTVLAGTPALALKLLPPEFDEPLPPRSHWVASASSDTQESTAPRLAIDGDARTRWGGEFSAGHWFQLDLGWVARVGGVKLTWDSAHAAGYQIQASEDGRAFHAVYEVHDAPGGIEYAFFAPVHARYLRLASLPDTSDWGVSLYEFEPIADALAPQLQGLAAPVDAARGVWSDAPSAWELAPTPGTGPRQLVLRSAAAWESTGLEVLWAGSRPGARLTGHDAQGWHEVARDPAGPGLRSVLAARTAGRYDGFRLAIDPGPGNPASPRITRLRLLGATQPLTPLLRYQLAAERAGREAFPSSLHGRQVYWTVVGVPAGLRKSVFDEWGDIEGWKGAPLVQPLWRTDDARLVSPHQSLGPGATVQAPTHFLRQGWMPMPGLEWSPAPGLTVRSEAFGVELPSGPATLVRHRIEASGTSPVSGRFSLLVRPLQMSPPWQNGGVAPIEKVQVRAVGADQLLSVNGAPLLRTRAADAAGAAPFGGHGETEITRYALEGRVPARTDAVDADGLAAAILSWQVRLAPGAHRDIVLALPLDGRAPVDVDGLDFDALAADVQRQWEQRLGGFELTLPDPSVGAMVRAQAAYMLLNQSGPAIQPGPRNYSRSFLRDGSATSVVLMRMGLPGVARDYLRWYATHGLRGDGMVHPILEADGAPNRGFGAGNEYDSQGEFLWFVGQVARLDGGAQRVREYQPQVRSALAFLRSLREPARGEGPPDTPPERVRGILKPSISHEGYSVPTHSYWDDFWALRGLRDAIWLAGQWGDAALERDAREQYASLRAAMRDSIDATMRWKGIDTIPADADLAGWDPTSVSIALDPCGEQELLPAAALGRTFDRYLEQAGARNADPAHPWAYTPYEMRNVLTFARLRRPDDAARLLERFLAGRRPAAWQELAEVVHSDERRAIYLGDMPHTWIGAETVRSVLGMLEQEDEDGITLLPATPASWLRGEGLRLRGLATGFGALAFEAREEGDPQSPVWRLHIAPGLQPDTAMRVEWPGHPRPRHVRVDGAELTAYGDAALRLAHPAREVQIEW